MKLLAIDTATEALSVALWLDGALVARDAVVHREHAARLPLLVPALLAEAGIAMSALDGLVCGIGPGSFAGVRIGVGYVKGLALGLDRPVVGVTSLAMLAQAALREQPEALALAAIDARMDEVYVGVYRWQDGRAVPVIEPLVCPPQALPPVPAGPWIGVGSGWGVHRDALLGALPGLPPLRIDADRYPSAADALALARPVFAAGAAVDGAALLPAYLRNRVALTAVEQQAARAAKAAAATAASSAPDADTSPNRP